MQKIIFYDWKNSKTPQVPSSARRPDIWRRRGEAKVRASLRRGTPWCTTGLYRAGHLRYFFIFREGQKASLCLMITLFHWMSHTLIPVSRKVAPSIRPIASHVNITILVANELSQGMIAKSTIVTGWFLNPLAKVLFNLSSIWGINLIAFIIRTSSLPPLPLDCSLSFGQFLKQMFTSVVYYSWNSKIRSPLFNPSP